MLYTSLPVEFETGVGVYDLSVAYSCTTRVSPLAAFNPLALSKPYLISHYPLRRVVGNQLSLSRARLLDNGTSQLPGSGNMVRPPLCSSRGITQVTLPPRRRGNLQTSSSHSFCLHTRWQPSPDCDRRFRRFSEMYFRYSWYDYRCYNFANLELEI